MAADDASSVGEEDCACVGGWVGVACEVSGLGNDSPVGVGPTTYRADGVNGELLGCEARATARAALG